MKTTKIFEAEIVRKVLVVFHELEWSCDKLCGGLVVYLRGGLM
jgi:hypothetical protein